MGVSVGWVLWGGVMVACGRWVVVGWMFGWLSVSGWWLGECADVFVNTGWFFLGGFICVGRWVLFGWMCG